LHEVHKFLIVLDRCVEAALLKAEATLQVAAAEA
jgi:hypothetical protein